MKWRSRDDDVVIVSRIVIDLPAEGITLSVDEYAQLCRMTGALSAIEGLILSADSYAKREVLHTALVSTLAPLEKEAPPA